MSSRIERQQDRVVVEGELTIYTATELKDQLMQNLILRQDPVVLDLSGVTEIDTAGVQLLLMARRVCAATSRKLVAKDPSAVVRETLTLCGLDQSILGKEAQS